MSDRSTKAASQQSLRALDGLNLFLADVRTGVGPFLAIYLASALQWDSASIGIAMSAMSLGSLIAQTPAGALIDRLEQKRLLVLVAAALVGISCLVMAASGDFYVIVAAQAVAGIAADVFPPAIAALTLGLVGRAALASQIGRNEAVNHAGNVVAAVVAGVIGAYVARQGIFYLTAFLAIGAIVASLLIRPEEIDHRLASGGDDAASSRPVALTTLFRDRRLFWFSVAVTLFHLANAAMLPEIGQELAQGKAAASMYMAACVIGAQLVMIPTALWSGRYAQRWGRKPVFLIGFAILPLRGVLYTLTDDPWYLLAIQCLDGIGAGIFGVVSVLMIADLTHGTGRFNFTQGAITTALSLGSAGSNILAGYITEAAGFNAGFLSLAGIAVLALVVFMVWVPETQRAEDTSESAIDANDVDKAA